MDLELLDKTDDFRLAAWRGVILLIWRMRSTAQGVERSYAAVRERAARPGGVVLMNVVPPNPSSPPDEATRKALRQVVQSPPAGLAGVATIHEGSGFISAFIRALVSGLQRLQSGVLPMRVFQGPREAAPWAAEHLRDPGITAAGLTEVIAAARER